MWRTVSKSKSSSSWPWICVFLLYTLILTTSAAIFTTDASKKDSAETEDIDLSLNDWSGSYTNFHQKEILNQYGTTLTIICETNEPVQNVLVKFKADGKSNMNSFDLNTIQSSDKKIWNHADVKKYSKFKNNQGGRITLALDEANDWTWNGKIWCELIESTANENNMIQSNDLQILDFRQTISNIIKNDMKIAVEVDTNLKGKGTTLIFYPLAERGFFSSGILPNSPVWYFGALKKTKTGYERIDMDQLEFGSPRKMLRQTEEMKGLGSYFIDRYDQLHLNLNANIFKRIFDSPGQDLFNRLFQPYSIGQTNSIYVPEPEKKSPSILFDLPKKVYPTSNSMKITVVRSLSSEYLECGFLAENEGLTIKWTRKDESISSWESLGFQLQPSGASIKILDSVKFEASGEYKCELFSNNVKVPDMESVFHVEILQLPYFGKRSSRSPGAGKPPPLIIVMDGDSVEMKCIVDGWPSDNSLITTMTPIVDSSLNAVLKLDWSVNYTSATAQDDTIWSIHAKQFIYRANNLQAIVPVIKKSHSHVVKCSAEGEYQIETTNKRKFKAEAYSNIRVIRKFTKENMLFLPVPCGKRVEKCTSSKENTFQCAMRTEMMEHLQNNSVSWHFFWKVGIYKEVDIENGESVLKKYVRFANDTVSILKVNSADDQKELNRLVQQIQCVFQLFYPKNTSKQWLHDKMMIKGGNGTSLPSLVGASLEFYSSENDVSMTHLIVNDFFLVGEPTVASANLWIVAPITLSALLIICIFVILTVMIYRNRGETYGIDRRERQQGRDPEKELKENNFNEYTFNESEAADNYQKHNISLSNSMRIGSDSDEKELDEYGIIDQGQFNEDGSFIGDYVKDPSKPKEMSTATEV